MVGEEEMYTASELKWLARNPFHKAKEWQNEDGKLKSVEDKVEDGLASKNAVSAA
jgi:hypothetical protein